MWVSWKRRSTFDHTLKAVPSPLAGFTTTYSRRGRFPKSGTKITHQSWNQTTHIFLVPPIFPLNNYTQLVCCGTSNYRIHWGRKNCTDVPFTRKLVRKYVISTGHNKPCKVHEQRVLPRERYSLCNWCFICCTQISQASVTDVVFVLLNVSFVRTPGLPGTALRAWMVNSQHDSMELELGLRGPRDRGGGRVGLGITANMSLR